MTRLLSVVMPAYNVAPYVGEAIRSVVDQEHPDIELLVIDDGSTDATADIVRDHAARQSRDGRAIRLIEQANQGASVARSTGLAAATGRYIGFLDADDWWDPPLASAMVERLEADERLDLAFPRVRYVDERGAPTGTVSGMRRNHFDFVDLLTINPINTATGVVIRREAAETVGSFDAELRSCIDLDYWVRIGQLRSGNIGGVNAVLANYRKRPGQITGDWQRMERGWRRVMAKAEAFDAEAVRGVFRRAEAHRRVYWATIAYQAGDFAAARRLIAQAWRGAPSAMIRNEDAVVRLGACLGSLLPDPLQRLAETSFNTVRHRGAGS